MGFAILNFYIMLFDFLHTLLKADDLTCFYPGRLPTHRHSFDIHVQIFGQRVFQVLWPGAVDAPNCWS